MNAPADQTKMTAPTTNATKMVKVNILRACRLLDGTVLEPANHPHGVSIPEADAEILCKPFDGYAAFAGERHISDGDVTVQKIVRAKRI